MSNDFVGHLGIDDSAEGALAATPGSEHTNAGGTVHGGYLATLLDASMGQAVREGSSNAMVTGVALDPSGERIAHAVGTFAIIHSE